MVIGIIRGEGRELAEWSIESIEQPTFPTLDELQKIVGGYLEGARMSNGLIYCNEDGVAQRLLPNATLKGLILGTVVFFKKFDGGGNSIGFDTHQEMVEALKQSIKNLP